jgi:hypothetical protein
LNFFLVFAHAATSDTPRQSSLRLVARVSQFLTPTPPPPPPPPPPHLSHRVTPCVVKAEVRAIVYDGLAELASGSPSAVRCAMFNMVHTQLLGCLSGADAEMPLRLDQCVVGDAERTGLYEPVDRLLRCVWRLIGLGAAQPGAAGAGAAGAAAAGGALMSSERDAIVALCRRLASSDFVHWELEKTTDFEGDSADAGRSRVRAAVLHGVLEVAVDVLIGGGDYGVDDCNTAVLVFKRMRVLGNLVCESKKGTAAIAASGPGLRLETSAELLRAVCHDRACTCSSFFLPPFLPLCRCPSARARTLLPPSPLPPPPQPFHLQSLLLRMVKDCLFIYSLLQFKTQCALRRPQAEERAVDPAQARRFCAVCVSFCGRAHLCVRHQHRVAARRARVGALD